MKLSKFICDCCQQVYKTNAGKAAHQRNCPLNPKAGIARAQTVRPVVTIPVPQPPPLPIAKYDAEGLMHTLAQVLNLAAEVGGMQQLQRIVDTMYNIKYGT